MLLVNRFGLTPKPMPTSQEQVDLWIENQVPVNLNNSADTLDGYTMQE